MRGETLDIDTSTAVNGNFNPLSPCGERRPYTYEVLVQCKFQSTLPMRGETSIRVCLTRTATFQSTLPMRGETDYFGVTTDYLLDFNPLSPCGERLVRYLLLAL